MEEVLVVDDEPMIRSMMKLTLGEMGYLVTGAASVEEALNIYERDRNRFQALVTDFNLEDGTGVDIVNTIKKQAQTTPVILMTGSVKISPRESVQAGFSAFFQKPFSCLDMGREIDSLLGKAS